MGASAPEIALMALDDCRLLDAASGELPKISPGFGSGHGCTSCQKFDLSPAIRIHGQS